MLKYEKGFDHTNTTDVEEEIISLASTAEEPKRIKRLVIEVDPAQKGYLTGYLDREKIMDTVPLFPVTTGNERREYPIDIELGSGETFVLKGINETAASNMSAVGFIEYEITE